MLRPSPLQPCRRAYPCSPPFTALRNEHPRYAVSIRRAPPCWPGLFPTLTGCGSFKRPLSGPFDGLTRSDLGLEFSRSRWRGRVTAIGAKASSDIGRNYNLSLSLFSLLAAL